MRLTVIVAGLLSIVARGPAAAQASPAPPRPTCSDSGVAGGGDYARCALWFDGRTVRQGVDGPVVAQPGLWSTLHLSRVVTGDSARAYALAYEHDMHAARTLSLIGTAFLVAGGVAIGSYDCGTRAPLGGCSNGDDVPYLTADAFLIGSAVLLAIETRLVRSATRAAAQAIWWSNARFGGR